MNELLSKTRTIPLDMGEKYEQKILINTINAHSYNVAQKDTEFYNALIKSDILIPDGVGIVYALRFMSGIRSKKIAAWDLMIYELEQLNKIKGKCFFLGSSEKVLKMLIKHAAEDFPDVLFATYSPPFKPVFNEEDNSAMINAINTFAPEVLFVGMTAPKQEKWSAKHFDRLNIKHVCCIGATFDFYAGTVKRAPKWWLKRGLEWLYRFIMEPKRLWRRYLLGIPKFAFLILIEKLKFEK
jgi:N-acetylglucosaminyldiphosphoundecaprenol N-acetyl-beta-D-mannosaminyltransferase